LRSTLSNPYASDADPSVIERRARYVQRVSRIDKVLEPFATLLTRRRAELRLALIDFFSACRPEAT
jgi:hypothetical protein